MANLFTKAPVLSTTELAPGIKKEVLTLGSGPTPTEGQTVHVHYTGKTLDGSVFDSSVSRGKPFSFRVGIGQVIKGWDVGVLSMPVGEKCVLTCSHENAYGESGSPPVIPPRATLGA